MDTNMIDVRNVHKVYGQGTSILSILHNLNLEVQKGDFAMVMGNSGSGKSTLLYMLGGIDTCSKGEIWLDDQLLKDKNEKEMTLLRRKKIGFVFQEHHLVSNLTLFENILIAGFLEQKDRKLVRSQAIHLMKELEIDGLINRYPAQVSGGEAQRCAMVRALINKPEVLLADEPTGNLNSSSSEKVLQCLQKLNNEGQTIVLVTHNLNAACYGSIVHFMNDGQIRDHFRFPQDYCISVRESTLFAWLKERGW